MASKLDLHERSLTSRGHRTEAEAREMIQTLKTVAIPEDCVVNSVSVTVQENGWEAYFKYVPADIEGTRIDHELEEATAEYHREQRELKEAFDWYKRWKRGEEGPSDLAESLDEQFRLDLP